MPRRQEGTSGAAPPSRGNGLPATVGDRAFVAAPLLLGLGISAWFALPIDPPGWAGLSALVLAGLSWLWGRGRADARRLAALAVALVLVGFALAGLRADRVAAPVLAHRYYGPVQGRVVAIDRSVSDKLRLTLDEVQLADVAPAATPARVRVALHGTLSGPQPPGVGDVVILTGHLAPPAGPVAPGAFDFARIAWFDRLGAVGYTRSPVLRLAPSSGLPLALGRLRQGLADAIRARAPGPPGALAAALATGDRSGLARPDVEALRAANLSHLLAISGLHLGLLAGFVFAAVRLGLAAVPALGLRLPGKKIAAVVALAAAAVYLALSGGNVATQRAFVMVAVMLAAVLADRQALSLRSVALAALVILALAPETLAEPGFQMSFAATTALVVVFSGIGGRLGQGLSWPLGWVLALVLSSAVAGAATAPIAAAQFNRVAAYGLLANLLAVPVMGTLVVPGAVLAACLAPLGLAAPGLWLMRAGSAWVLMVAHAVAALDGALQGVPSPPGWAIPVLALSGAAAVLLPGRWRGLALVGAAAAAFGWTTAVRPALLVAPDAALVGLIGSEGRALSKPAGAGFVAMAWLEDDGDLAAQDLAAARPGLIGPPGARQGRLGGRAVWHLWGKGAVDRAALACTLGAIVIVAVPVGDDPRFGADCLVIDPDRLRATGALAIDADATGALRIVSARDRSGRRAWTRWATDADARLLPDRWPPEP